MTQSRASAKASSDRRRSVADSERVREEGVDLPLPQRSAELLGASPAVDEHQPLLAAMQRLITVAAFVDGADVVELHLGSSVPAPAGGCHHGTVTAGGGALQPREQLVGVADGG